MVGVEHEYMTVLRERINVPYTIANVCDVTGYPIMRLHIVFVFLDGIDAQALQRFVSELIKFRRGHPALGRENFLA